MAAINWTDGSDSWTTAADWSGKSVPASGDTVTIALGSPVITSNVGTIASLAVTTSGSLVLNNGGSLATSGSLMNSGTISLDNGFEQGGSSLTVKGTLTNDGGTLQAGDMPGLGTLSSPDTITVAALVNSESQDAVGTISLYGGDSVPVKLVVTTGAAGFGTAGVLTGAVSLSDDASIQFASGKINSITAGSSLTLFGADASIADAGGGSNSALNLSEIDGELFFSNGVQLVSTGALTNNGTILLGGGLESGGTTLAVGGTLTNDGQISIGGGSLTTPDKITVAAIVNDAGSSAEAAPATITLTGGGSQAALIVTTGAAGFGTQGVLTGDVTLTGDALVQFATGQITSIAANSLLSLSGSSVSVGDAGGGVNSALNLSSIAGELDLADGISLSTGALTNTGIISLDPGFGTGGTTLTVNGTLTNENEVDIGTGSTTSPDTLTVAALVNVAGASPGTISLMGGTSAPSTLIVTSSAGFGTAGVLTGDVNLTSDATITFAGGTIGTIAANSALSLSGTNASVADAGGGTNSALNLSVIDGGLTLSNGASLTMNSGLTLGDGTDAASLTVESGTITGDLGAMVSIDGSFAVASNATVSIANSSDIASSMVMATTLSNAGTIDITGNPFVSVTGELQIQGSASNTGTIALSDGGILKIAGALTGNGTITLASGAMLEIGGTATGGGTISFAPGTGAEVKFDGAAPTDSISGLAAGDMIDLAAVTYKSSYEAVFFVNASGTGGTLEIVDTAAGDALIDAMTLTGLNGETLTLTADANGNTEISAQADPLLQASAGDVVFSSISGQAYSAYEEVFNLGQYVGIDYFYTNITGEAYSAYELEYSVGNDFVGSKFLYTNVSGQDYTTEEFDYDGGGNTTRVVFTGISDQPYSSYEYDYNGGVYAGAKFEFTAVADGTPYSSYEIDYDSFNNFVGDKFLFTNVADQSYTSAEEDFDASGNLAKVILAGFSGQGGLSSLEEDFSGGTYEGYKAFYSVNGQAYTGEEVDVSAPDDTLTRVVYSGFTGTPYSSVTENFSNTVLTSTTYDFTDVANQSFSAYQTTEDANGNLLQETVDNNDGSHTIVGFAANQTFTSIGNDTFTGGGANETFVFNPAYGHDTITDFSSYLTGAGHDTISLATSEFASLAAVIADTQNVGANAVITAANGDTITLNNVTVAALSANPGDFTFHA